MERRIAFSGLALEIMALPLLRDGRRVAIAQQLVEFGARLAPLEVVGFQLRIVLDAGALWRNAIQQGVRTQGDEAERLAFAEAHRARPDEAPVHRERERQPEIGRA